LPVEAQSIAEDARDITSASDSITLSGWVGTDFGETIALSGGRAQSAILFRLRNTRTQFVLDRLHKVLSESAQALEQGVIISVEDTRYRVRHLPLGK